MKTTPALLLAALIGASALTGCKTTEAAYANAYEIARQKKEATITDEERAGVAREEARQGITYKGEHVPLRSIYVRRFDGAPRVEKYSVIMASFKQKFNANSVFNRLKQGGYPDAIILTDADDQYYVAALTTPDLDTAVAAMKAIAKATPVAPQKGCPYILQAP